ncbi:hypothetical protein L208DRAFT_1383005 [Tricholoma matsutake]|nr:hypothetical protein L208DRAFT_1383005 [Tricholoma matsutake 945]
MTDRRRRKCRRSDSKIKKEQNSSPEIHISDVTPIPLSSPIPPLNHDSSPDLESPESTSYPTTKHKGKARAKESIVITAKLKVDKIELIMSVPSTWTVPRESVAYLVDVTDMGDEPTKCSGETLSLDAYIRAEDQESWGGSSGHAQGDAHPDENAMQELWSHELSANECEAGSISAIMSRYLGPSKHGKHYFIGCANWKSSECFEHRYLAIPANVDEIQFKHVFESGGKLLSQITDNHKCVLTVHPKVGLKKCPYSHVIDGKIIPAKIIRRKCPTEMIIFVPVDKEIRKAVIILCNPHNHPMHPRTKPSFKDKKKITKAIHAAGTTGLTVLKLMNVPSLIVDQQLAPSTALVYDGSSIADHSLPYMNWRRLCDKIQEEKLKEYPKGMGWDEAAQILGLGDWLVTYNNPESSNITSRNALVLLFNIDRLPNTVSAEVIKWLKGFVGLASQSEIDKWHAFCRSVDDESVQSIDTIIFWVFLFTEFADTVTRVTGSILKLHAFFPDGSLRCIILDAEAAQILGLGDWLVTYNNPESSNITSRNALVLLFNIDRLPNTVSAEVIKQLKGFVGLASQSEIDEWHAFGTRIKSSMSESWDLTPNHSNLAETAHAARNAETSIGIPVLTAVLQAREWDNAKAKEIELMEKSGNMPHRWNGPDKRELLQAQRQAWGLRKSNVWNDQLARYDELQEERQIGIEQNKESLGQQKVLKGQKKEIQEAFKTGKQSDLKVQLDRIGIDIKGEQELHRKWRSRQKDIDDEVWELKTGGLNGARLNGWRQINCSRADSYSESQLGVDGVASPEGCPEPIAQEVEFIQDNLNGEDGHLLMADIEPETAADARKMDDLALLDIDFSFADVHDLDFGTIDMETPAQSLEQPTDWNMSYY